jgi:hypothetical protein
MAFGGCVRKSQRKLNVCVEISWCMSVVEWSYGYDVSLCNQPILFYRLYARDASTARKGSTSNFMARFTGCSRKICLVLHISTNTGGISLPKKSYYQTGRKINGATRYRKGHRKL